MSPLRFAPYIRKQITRHAVRSALTIAGIAIAMFLFTAVQAMNSGVVAATTATSNDTTLVVYRADRYCPATSQLPQDYQRRIESVPGVVNVTPMKIVVTNCRTSLDVVTFRGVPKDDFIAARAADLTLIAGSFDEWSRRTDAALLGETLANRRGLRPGMTFDAAGITAYVAGIIRSKDPQEQNVAYTALEFVQLAGRDQLGIVTQFNVNVTDASYLEPAADDIIELVAFARWLGLGALAAVLALVANAIVLSVQSRISEHAVLQTLGYSGRKVAALIIAEGTLLAITGGLVGAAAAIAVARFGNFALSVEGTSIPIVAGPALLATGFLVCAAIGVLAGLVPAWQASRREIAECFRAV